MFDFLKKKELLKQQELARLQKQLQEQFDPPLEEFETREVVFFNMEEPYQAQVTFLLPYHDWCELQQLKCWKKVQKFLGQKGNTRTQKNHTKPLK